MTLRRICLGLLVCLVAVAGAFGEDPPRGMPPESPEKAADKALAAVAAKDDAALKALASRDKPDPWMVADELCARDAFDAAAAFAKAAPRAAVDALPAYVDAARQSPPAKEARAAIAAANAMFAFGRWQDALAKLDAAPSGGA